MKYLLFAAIAFLVNPSWAAEAPAQTVKSEEPFTFGDFTWMNGQDRRRETGLLKTQYLNFGVYVDSYYNYTFSQPMDNTVVGNSTIGRTNEFQVNLISANLDTNLP